MWILDGRTADGGVRSRMYVLGNDSPLGNDYCVIFIHGFNKGEEEASAQAKTFFALFRAKLKDSKRVCDAIYSWPATRNRRTSVSLLNYPRRIPVAMSAGRLLGGYLADNRATILSECQVVLIGHSLGAVVALEAAKRFQERSGHAIDLLALTGAAVPSLELAKDGNYEMNVATQNVDLFCPADVTLRWLFRLGTRAHSAGEISGAVGLEGRPSERFLPNIETDVWHHKYWKEPVTASTIVQLIGGPHLAPVRSSRRRQVAVRLLSV